jgi:CHASE2 domain-containing sensor protein
VLSLVITLLTILLFQSIGGFSNFELATFDHRAGLFRADKTINDNVVVILIDEASLQSMEMQESFLTQPMYSSEAM